MEALMNQTHPARRHAGYSSVGRASDCRVLQLSDGPWFDSGWPDLMIRINSAVQYKKGIRQFQIHPARIKLATFSVSG